MKIQIKGFVFAGLAAAIFAGNAMAAGDTIVTSKAYVDQKLGLKANTADLATVATTGSYNDLSNKPTIPAAQVNADWNATSGVAQILNKPSIPAAQVNADWNATSGVAQILNKPSLATVATTGDYDDLSNKPTIPTVPTNVSAFTNDAQYITSADVPAAQTNADWNATSGAGEILNKPTTLAGYGITDAATSAQGAKADTAVQPGDLAAVATTGSYNDLTNKPTIPAAQVNADWNSTSGVSQILNKPTLSAVATSGNYSDLSGTPNLATVATSGSYTDLSDKPTIPAAQVQSDWNATTGMGAILNKPTLATVATSGSYNDLTNKPTLGTAAAADTSAFATAAQGALADTAIQPGSCSADEPCALVNNAWVRIAQVGD